MSQDLLVEGKRLFPLSTPSRRTGEVCGDLEESPRRNGCGIGGECTGSSRRVLCSEKRGTCASLGDLSEQQGNR